MDEQIVDLTHGWTPNRPPSNNTETNGTSLRALQPVKRPRGVEDYWPHCMMLHRCLKVSSAKYSLCKRNHTLCGTMSSAKRAESKASIQQSVGTYVHVDDGNKPNVLVHIKVGTSICAPLGFGSITVHIEIRRRDRKR